MPCNFDLHMCVHVPAFVRVCMRVCVCVGAERERGYHLALLQLNLGLQLTNVQKRC